MKLEKFETNKNKKKKAYITMAIVGVLLVTAFVLYRSYALYQEEKTYNVLNGVIPDFNKTEFNSDIQLAFTVNGNKVNEYFPVKKNSITNAQVTCQNGATASWDLEKWALTNINAGQNENISCNIDFTMLPICKRATSLHKENCNSNRSFCQNSNEEITYGNLGTAGTLTTGDAFDCDVNGDGIYDSENERFYYITDLEDHNDTAVLYSGKSISEVDYLSFAYDGEPVEPIVYTTLPKNDTWKNTKLKITNRYGYDDGNKTNKLLNYEGYSARLLTERELVTSSCADSSGFINFNKCSFLYSDSYSKDKNIFPLLEDVSSLDRCLYMIAAYPSSDGSPDYFKACNGVNDETFGNINPVIEITKTNIEY